MKLPLSPSFYNHLITTTKQILYLEERVASNSVRCLSSALLPPFCHHHQVISIFFSNSSNNSHHHHRHRQPFNLMSGTTMRSSRCLKPTPTLRRPTRRARTRRPLSRRIPSTLSLQGRPTMAVMVTSSSSRTSTKQQRIICSFQLHPLLPPLSTKLAQQMPPLPTITATTITTTT